MCVCACVRVCVCAHMALFIAVLDGAELLLDLGLPAGIIGGVVLPLLGAVPDSAMIVFSGMGGTKEEAQQQIDVGMGCVCVCVCVCCACEFVLGCI